MTIRFLTGLALALSLASCTPSPAPRAATASAPSTSVAAPSTKPTPAPPVPSATVASQAPSPELTPTSAPSTSAPSTSAPPVASTASPGPEAQAGPPDPKAILAAYKTDAFVKVNATGINGTGPHTFGRPLFIYVDKAHAPLYKKDVKGPMPEGTTIVKVAADGEDKLVAIMVKLKAGTDPGAADWFFWEQLGGSVPFDGNATKGGGFCYSCHKGAPAAADNLLGTGVFGQ